MSLTYSIITPARDEAAHIPRLAEALRAQERAPRTWVIVENGSTDETAEVAETIAATYEPARLLSIPADRAPGRGAPIVRAFQAGLAAIDDGSDVIVNVDADVTMDPDYFELLIRAFERSPRLGIASGSAYELEGDIWRQRFVTGGTVWGATRAYRLACLEDVMPLEERHGWDGIDQLKARSRGWQTATFTDLPFRHHRPEGARDGSSWAHWRANGETAYFMGYRPSYLLLRSAFRAWREPSAVGLIHGYLQSAGTRAPRLDDPPARALLREDQRLRNLVARRREALGQAATDATDMPCTT